MSLFNTGFAQTMTRLLIIEDNTKTANYLLSALKENYFLPDIATDGQEGIFLAAQNNYEVIILDIMIPIIDGWDVLKRIRQYNKKTFILLLTACDKINDRVKGLELGADDYLVKPFAFTELLARIRSLLRRKNPQESDPLQIADLTIDIAKHKAMRGNIHIPLTAKEFMLLVLLTQRKGEVLSRTLIAEQVWDINFECDTKTIDVAIKRLRDKVDGAFDKKLIHTIRGVGYVLEDR
jgi:two-component system, OmpR family, copper resistance phosphate regulon response regulator CusR